MEDSVAEEVEASNQKKKKGSIQIVKLEYVEGADEETKEKDKKNTNPIPG